MKYESVPREIRPDWIERVPYRHLLSTYAHQPCTPPPLAFNAVLKSPPCNPLGCFYGIFHWITNKSSRRGETLLKSCPNSLINVALRLDCRTILYEIQWNRRVIFKTRSNFLFLISETPLTSRRGITGREKNSTWNDSTEGSPIINTLRKHDRRCEITVSPFLPPFQRRWKAPSLVSFDVSLPSRVRFLSGHSRAR